jgi:hypothetical protein
MKKPSKIKDREAVKYIAYLEDELFQYTNSPLLASYLSTLTFLNRVNKQIIEKEIDIFDEKAKPRFDMAHKFLTEKQPYLEQLEYIRALMTPNKQKELQKEIEILNLNMAERLALNVKNEKS